MSYWIFTSYINGLYGAPAMLTLVHIKIPFMSCPPILYFAKNPNAHALNSLLICSQASNNDFYWRSIPPKISNEKKIVKFYSSKSRDAQKATITFFECRQNHPRPPDLGCIKLYRQQTRIVLAFTLRNRQGKRREIRKERKRDRDGGREGRWCIACRGQ